LKDNIDYVERQERRGERRLAAAYVSSRYRVSARR